MQYDFPSGLKPASAHRRERFYQSQFDETHVDERLERWPELSLMIDVGTDSTLYKPRFKELKGKLLRVPVTDLSELQEKLVEYAPEDVYYDRTLSKDGEIPVNPRQELVFRLTPDRIHCTSCERKRQYMDKQWHKYVFCGDCFEGVAEETRDLYGFLERHFDEMLLVYTGIGFHIHVEDEEAFEMTVDDRRELARKVGSQFPIDEDITAGENSLIRLPGSLNGVVSRQVVPVSVNDLAHPIRMLEDCGEMTVEDEATVSE